ncbi:hypothetical protein [Pontivivens ytuae]|uniref:Uncharacterized protein n=1 Tax=Pontivivens ytuae TaxID=2789856 RepID=A0A7S9LS37_9RHOB|nr:hypothetical protein [Pontivivens ytuae]QPH54238.1 hypothetical protein I0K15_00220 [Pontivivens ytuae]
MASAPPAPTVNRQTIGGPTHRDSYGDIARVAVALPLTALVAVVLLGSAFGSF